MEAHFTDYSFKERQGYLVCAKSATVGTNIVLRKNRLMVVGNFPSLIGQILFTLSIVFLGVIIPLIIYFAVFHSKLKKLENEISAYLSAEYNLEI